MKEHVKTRLREVTPSAPSRQEGVIHSTFISLGFKARLRGEMGNRRPRPHHPPTQVPDALLMVMRLYIYSYSPNKVAIYFLLIYVWEWDPATADAPVPVNKKGSN